MLELSENQLIHQALAEEKRGLFREAIPTTVTSGEHNVPDNKNQYIAFLPSDWKGKFVTLSIYTPTMPWKKPQRS